MGLLDNIVGALEKASDTLDTVDKAAGALDGTKRVAEEIADESLGTLGTVVRAARYADRGRNMILRLTDPARPEKPGTLEVLSEAGNFLFGEDPNEKR